MSLHDLFTQAGRTRAGRRFRPRLARRGLGLPSPRGRKRGRGGVRATARGRRRLAAIDRALAAETPRLASMFALFNALAAEEPVGTERLPTRAWPRPKPAQLAFLATLAAIVALCAMLSTQLHSVIRPCQTSASASSGTSGLSAFAPARELSCRAYATPNK
jgi:hypothetical protein